MKLLPLPSGTQNYCPRGWLVIVYSQYLRVEINLFSAFRATTQKSHFPIYMCMEINQRWQIWASFFCF